MIEDDDHVRGREVPKYRCRRRPEGEKLAKMRLTQYRHVSLMWPAPWVAWKPYQGSPEVDVFDSTGHHIASFDNSAQARAVVSAVNAVLEELGRKDAQE